MINKYFVIFTDNIQKFHIWAIVYFNKKIYIKLFKINQIN